MSATKLEVKASVAGFLVCRFRSILVVLVGISMYLAAWFMGLIVVLGLADRSGHRQMLLEQHGSGH